MANFGLRSKCKEGEGAATHPISSEKNAIITKTNPASAFTQPLSRRYSILNKVIGAIRSVIEAITFGHPPIHSAIPERVLDPKAKDLPGVERERA